MIVFVHVRIGSLITPKTGKNKLRENVEVQWDPPKDTTEIARTDYKIERTHTVVKIRDLNGYCAEICIV